MRLALLASLSLLSTALWAEIPTPASTPAAAATPVTAAIDPTKPIAHVNGSPIPHSHYEFMLQHQFAGKSLNDAQRKALIEALVARELVMQQAVKEGLDKDPDILSKLENGRLQLIAVAWTQRWLNQHPISDAAIAQEYETWKAAQASQEYKLRHILLSDEATAKAVIEQLKQGTDFGKLAQEKSQDPSGKLGGDIGWVTPDKLIGKLKEVVPTLEKGKFGPEPVQTSFGWHVLLVDETRAAPVAELKDMQQKLSQKLQQQAIAAEFKRLRDAAKVEIP